MQSKRALQELVKNELRPGSPLIIKTPDFPEKAECVAEKLINTIVKTLQLSYDTKLKTLVTCNNSRNIFKVEIFES